jgi:hypothetical protein
VHIQGSPKTPLANAIFDELTKVCDEPPDALAAVAGA